MCGLGVLLASVELVEAVHRYERGQYELTDRAQEIADGTPGIGGVHVAACDRQKVFRFDPGDIADMSGRTPQLPSAERILGHVMTQPRLEEHVGSELLGAHPYRSQEHPRRNVDMAHPSTQCLTYSVGDVVTGQHLWTRRPISPTVMTVRIKQCAHRNAGDVLV